MKKSWWPPVGLCLPALSVGKELVYISNFVLQPVHRAFPAMWPNCCGYSGYPTSIPCWTLCASVLFQSLVGFGRGRGQKIPLAETQGDFFTIPRKVSNDDLTWGMEFCLCYLSKGLCFFVGVLYRGLLSRMRSSSDGIKASTMYIFQCHLNVTIDTVF